MSIETEKLLNRLVKSEIQITLWNDYFSENQVKNHLLTRNIFRKTNPQIRSPKCAYQAGKRK